MTTQNHKLETCSDGTHRYAGLVLLAGPTIDDKYWVSGQERWMTLVEMDELLADREEAQRGISNERR
jgi:hypothetical protein